MRSVEKKTGSSNEQKYKQMVGLKCFNIRAQIISVSSGRKSGRTNRWASQHEINVNGTRERWCEHLFWKKSNQTRGKTFVRVLGFAENWQINSKYVLCRVMQHIIRMYRQATDTMSSVEWSRWIVDWRGAQHNYGAFSGISRTISYPTNSTNAMANEAMGDREPDDKTLEKKFQMCAVAVCVCVGF